MPLRPLTEEDLPSMLTWRNAPSVRRNMFTKHEISEAEHQAWFARIKNDPQSSWLIHEDDAGLADGVVYFTQIQPFNRSAFWGFYAAENAQRGAGTRMGFDALEMAFDDLMLHKLNGEVLITNEQSIRFHKKLGFKEEGHLRAFSFDGENYVDVIRLGILADEWRAIRNAIQTRIAKFH